MFGLGAFLGGVYARVERAVAHGRFEASHHEQLRAVVRRPADRAAKAPLGDPLCTIYLVCRAHSRAIDDQVEQFGAFCLFYLTSLDLFDDAQDDDLAGSPYAELGIAQAINDAITLGFLAQEQLREVVAAEKRPTRRDAWLELASRVSLLAAAGQHRDLLGADGALTPDEVIAMQAAKTSSLSLLVEGAALLVGGDAEVFRGLGEQLAVFVQIRDDLRDIFGKQASPDLATGKITYPLACFHEQADATQRATLQASLAALPSSLPAIRRLLYTSGAVAASARTLEAYRQRIHRSVGTACVTAPCPAALRLLLDVVDGLAEGVYTPPPLPATVALWRPTTRWHREVRQAQADFVSRMASRALPTPPTLRPWHQAHFMYLPAKATIYYPDVDGLPDEVLPFQAHLLGADQTVAAETLRQQAPLVIAHEMFHFWRDAAGRLTSDHWHEEWAANRLAVAYAAKYEVRALARTAALCDHVLGRFPPLSSEAEALLEAASTFGGETKGYGMSIEDTALLTLEMVRRFVAQPCDLDEAMQELLTPAMSASA